MGSKIVGWVDGKEERDDGRVLQPFRMPGEIMIAGSDGVERGSKGGDVDQVSTGPILLEASENVIIRLVSVQVDRNDGSGSTHTVTG